MINWSKFLQYWQEYKQRQGKTREGTIQMPGREEGVSTQNRRHEMHKKGSAYDECIDKFYQKWKEKNDINFTKTCFRK